MSTRRKVLLIVLAVVVVVGTTAGVMWWRHEDSFCTKVSNLPDVMASVSKSGTPASGFLDYANKLDGVASVAPDSATADAARQLASAQRSLGEALAGSTTNSTIVNAVGATATADVAAAQTQLNTTIAAKCS